jgi:hypothetical protein
MTDQPVGNFDGESILTGLDIDRYDDWTIFEKRLQNLLRSGRLRSISPLRGKQRTGENWYFEEETKNIYLYSEPTEKGHPEWKKVDPFSGPEPDNPSRSVLKLDLGDIPVGRMDRSQALSLLTQLFILVGFGKIETVDRPFPAAPGEHTETWFRNPRNGVVYKLVEGDCDNDSYWGPVLPHEMQAKAQ